MAEFNAECGKIQMFGVISLFIWTLNAVCTLHACAAEIHHRHYHRSCQERPVCHNLWAKRVSKCCFDLLHFDVAVMFMLIGCCCIRWTRGTSTHSLSLSLVFFFVLIVCVLLFAARSIALGTHRTISRYHNAMPLNVCNKNTNRAVHFVPYSALQCLLW